MQRPWCWERLRAGGQGDGRGWDGWMASPTQWTWVWVNSGSWWWTGRPGMLQFMGLQRVGHDWATELNWTEANKNKDFIIVLIRLYLVLICLYLVVARVTFFFFMYVHARSVARSLWDSRDCSSLWLRHLCPWDFPGKNNGCHFPLQGIFPTQGSNLHLLHLLHCRRILLLLSHQGSPFHPTYTHSYFFFVTLL